LSEFLKRRIAVTSRGLRAISTLPAIFDDAELLFGIDARFGAADAVLAWGRKPSAIAARRFAETRGLPTLQIEDGFLRSVGLGLSGPPLSLAVDDLGIYYDADSPSRLEQLVIAGCPAEEESRTAALIESWRAARVSKYNHARDAEPAGIRSAVLVIDQTRGDESIRCGRADAQDFTRMLEAALDEHPGRPVLLKVHPDVLAGRKQGHFDRLTEGLAARIRVCASETHPASLLEHVACVYAVTSQMGFEALLWGKSLRCFGMPFYAGWGLSSDALKAPERRRPASLHDLVHGALLKYARYIDPETRRRCEAERLIEHLALQRRMRQRFAAEVHALSFSRWKKPIVRAYFGGSKVSFVSRASQLPAGATVAVWGSKSLPAAVRASGIIRLEDGFLRSVGLGAELVQPLSWVMDDMGLYYDPARPSRLAHICATQHFDPDLLRRARLLRERIVAQGLTKYNVGRGSWLRPKDAARVVLVVGQVETDASIGLGAPGIRSNLALVQAARALAPDARLVYKPHPDVVARLRRAGAAESTVADFCDEVIADAPIGQLLDQVDEVQVMTSLAGFEALLRGRHVVVHGQPFYSGWGLTDDRCPIEGRQRRLTLDELVAAALILYPSYLSATTGAFTTPERVLDELQAWRHAEVARPFDWRGTWRAARRTIIRFLRAGLAPRG
jgi:capsular polysaccharide export protein